MFADLKNVPAFEGSSASAWSCCDKDLCTGTSANEPPAPNEADVKALLRMLSCHYDDDANEAFTLQDRLDLQSDSDDAESNATGTQNSLDVNGGSSCLQLFPHKRDSAAPASERFFTSMASSKEPKLWSDVHGASANLSNNYPCCPSATTNALTGSNSSAGSHSDRPASTGTPCGSDSSTCSPTLHGSRHNTVVSNALAGIGSGLAEENFNVLTPDKKMMLSIPAEYIQTTFGSRNYRHRNRDKLLFSFCLCKTFCSGATCHHGSECDFIHCDPEKLRLVQSAAAAAKGANPATVHSFQVHWSTPVASLAEAAYPRLPSGSVVYVKGGDSVCSNSSIGNSNNGTSANATRALPSEMVYATVGGKEALRLPPNAPLRVCKHFEREKCARGALCHFIHPVVLSKPSMGNAAAAGFVPPRVAPGARQQPQPQLQVHRDVSNENGFFPPSPPVPSTPLQQQHHLQPMQQQQQQQQHQHQHQSAPLLTAAQLPSGALVRYGDALYMWNPERQQLVPLQTTAANPAGAHGPAAANGMPPAMMVNVDYRRGPNGGVVPPPAFQMPNNAMLVQSSSAFAAYPPRNGNNTAPAAPQSFLNRNAAPNESGASSPMYPSMLFPC